MNLLYKHEFEHVLSSKQLNSSLDGRWAVWTLNRQKLVVIRVLAFRLYLHYVW